MTVRTFWVLVHRYGGLAMTIFLIIVALTGSVLAFYNELDRWLNPGLLTVPLRDTPALDPFTLRERAEALEPRARVDYVDFTRRPGDAYLAGVSPKTDSVTGKEYELPNNQFYLDPYTGEKLGARQWGEASLSRKNLIPFLYRLHYSLALPQATGNLGGYILGVTALVWTFDCFIGFYLTLPPRRRSATAQAGHPRSWGERWKPAWLIKLNAGVYRINYDIHRAFGLWVWAMLFVLAWSSVAFNLNAEVFQPVMKLFFDMRAAADDLPKLDKPLEVPALGWREAHAIGQRLMKEASVENGFAIDREETLSLDREHGLYQYTVRSSEEHTKYGGTTVMFDANTGVLKLLDRPSTRSAGIMITSWLIWLHMASVFGLPMQIFICAMGFIITALSVTGVVIWLRKRHIWRVAAQRQSRSTEGKYQ